MDTLVIRNAHTIVTMDAERREITDGAIVIEGNVIRWVGPTDDLPIQIEDQTSQVLCGRDRIFLPGLINTHHHFFQTLTRALPMAQNSGLFQWLKTHYPIWAELTPEDIRISTQIALCELLLSGCTTSSDHHYIWPNGSRLDDQFEAAADIGARFHGARGSMSLGESEGGLPPDCVTEDEAHILSDSRRVVEQFHDQNRFAMQRVVLAPCSPFSVSPDLMRDSAALARSFGSEAAVHLHTHLAETMDEELFCIKQFGERPGLYARELDWIGHDVWHAHCVHLDQQEIEMFAHSGTGVAHCPSSNMRLASGIAPIRTMLEEGVHVALGVDGSASNDHSHLMSEARQAMLLQRIQCGPAGLNAREVLELATLGGAAVLGRDDIGSLAAGMAADIVAYDLGALSFAGAAVHDPVAALLFCLPQNADLVMVDGKILVREGHLQFVDVPHLVNRHNRAAIALLQRAGVA